MTHHCDYCDAATEALKLATADNAALRDALNEATDAIDAVESEPGRNGQHVFAVDWVRALKLVRASPNPGAALLERLAAAEREVARLTAELGYATDGARVRGMDLRAAESRADRAAAEAVVLREALDEAEHALVQVRVDLVTGPKRMTWDEYSELILDRVLTPAIEAARLTIAVPSTEADALLERVRKEAHDAALALMREHVVRCIEETEPIQHKTVGTALRARDLRVRAAALDSMEVAWGVIANAHGGDWSLASPEWREAAEHWRDNHWHKALDIKARLASSPRDEEVKP